MHITTFKMNSTSRFLFQITFKMMLIFITTDNVTEKKLLAKTYFRRYSHLKIRLTVDSCACSMWAQTMARFGVADNGTGLGDWKKTNSWPNTTSPTSELPRNDASASVSSRGSPGARPPKGGAAAIPSVPLPRPWRPWSRAWASLLLFTCCGMLRPNHRSPPALPCIGAAATVRFACLFLLSVNPRIVPRTRIRRMVYIL